MADWKVRECIYWGGKSCCHSIAQTEGKSCPCKYKKTESVVKKRDKKK